MSFPGVFTEISVVPFIKPYEGGKSMRRGVWVGLILLFLLICGFSFGAIIYLKNGITVVGDIIMENDTEIIVRTEKYGEGRIKKGAISYIEHTDSEEISYGESTIGKYTNTENLGIKPAETNVSLSSILPGTNKLQTLSTNVDTGFPMLFGLCSGFSLLWEGFSLILSTFNNDTRFIMSPGIFIDMVYLRLEFECGFSLNPVVVTRKSMTGSSFTDTNSFAYMSISVLPKIPFKISPSVISWLAFGIEYDIMVMYRGFEYNQVFLFWGLYGYYPVGDSEDMLKVDWFNKNDFWLRALAGVDIELSDSFYLNLYTGWSYNLTASPIKAEYGTTYYVFFASRLDFSIGFSFKL